jgi:hypothetical protein
MAEAPSWDIPFGTTGELRRGFPMCRGCGACKIKALHEARQARD